jgi:hypothetical protein
MRLPNSTPGEGWEGDQADLYLDPEPIFAKFYNHFVKYIFSEVIKNKKI